MSPVFAFFYALHCVHSSFAIILKRKRKLVALLLLSYISIVAINVLWLFLAVPWVGLQCVIVVFPDHIHLLFALIHIDRKCFKDWSQSSSNTKPEKSYLETIDVKGD